MSLSLVVQLIKSQICKLQISFVISFSIVTKFCLFVLSAAKVVVELTKSPHIQAAVLLHPSRITLDDIKGITYNFSFGTSFFLDFGEKMGLIYYLHKLQNRKLDWRFIHEAVL